MDLRDIPVFNVTMYENLIDADDAEFAKEIVNEWLQQAKSCVPEMEELLSQRNWAQLSEKGHFLKGTSAFVGADRVKQICDELQNLKNHKGDVGGLEDFCRLRIRSLPVEIENYATFHSMFVKNERESSII